MFLCIPPLWLLRCWGWCPAPWGHCDRRVAVTGSCRPSLRLARQCNRGAGVCAHPLFGLAQKRLWWYVVFTCFLGFNFDCLILVQLPLSAQTPFYLFMITANTALAFFHLPSIFLPPYICFPVSLNSDIVTLCTSIC